MTGARAASRFAPVGLALLAWLASPALPMSAAATRGALGAQETGPGSQLERAWLLFAEGETEEGRAALESALPNLAPGRATEVIQLLAALARVGPVAGEALARSAAALHQGRPSEARAAVDGALAAVPHGDRPPLLHRAARLALDQADTLAATERLATLVDDHAASPEAPEAMLWLARLTATDPARVDEARALLRRLIIERPQAAVVPAARRELDRLGRVG
jgi:hypothetical protein